MALVALLLYVAFLALLFGLRSVVMRRRTGTTGFRGLSGAPGSAAWWGGVLFVLALLLGLLAPVLALAGALDPIGPLDGRAAHVAGLALVAAGTLLSLLAQAELGTSWRVGVAERERTALVTGGLYALARNPFFAALLPAAAGFALLVPNVLALLGLALLLLAVELQTRVVEEPYLLRVHGEAYARYAARVGRFAPGVGRLRPPR